MSTANPVKSTAGSARIFGIPLGVDPKILIAGLVLVAGALYWYNSRTDEGGQVRTPAAITSPSAAPAGSPGTGAQSKRTQVSRRSNAAANDRGSLRVRPIDATRGDVDPTLRLDLLSRLSAVEQGKIGRSVFESATTDEQTQANLAKIKAPKIPVAPVVPLTPPAAPPPTVHVPLKYYGYVKPEEKSEANRGLFLDGDNVLVAVEGQLVKEHYLVVELTPTSARMEDTQLKMGQTLPVVPQAIQP